MVWAKNAGIEWMKLPPDRQSMDVQTIIVQSFTIGREGFEMSLDRDRRHRFLVWPRLADGRP
jgi:hypothetical protein